MFQMLRCIFEIIQFFHFYPLFLALGWSLRHVLDKILLWHFQSTLKEIIWTKIFLNYMHGLKSAILAIFQRGLGWLCPVSKALKNASSGADEYLETLEGKIRDCLLFYVKIF